MKRRWQCWAMLDRPYGGHLVVPLSEHWTRGAAQREADRRSAEAGIDSAGRDLADAPLRFRPVHIGR